MNASLLSERAIRINASFRNKEEAIRACGRILEDEGRVEEGYIELMIERDRASTVYVGNGVAVPHGTKASQRFVKSTGLAIVQVPDGVDFGNGNVARLLVALAARGDEHIDLLTEIAETCADDERLDRLLAATSPAELLAALGAGA
jgi:Mannitol/fructose-specific phosphotransferase system, IIA domain